MIPVPILKMRKLGRMVFVLFLRVIQLLITELGSSPMSPAPSTWGFENPRALLSLLLSSCGFHCKRHLEARKQHRTRAHVWMGSKLEGAKLLDKEVSDSGKQDWGAGARKRKSWQQQQPINTLCVPTSLEEVTPLRCLPTNHSLLTGYKSVTPVT